MEEEQVNLLFIVLAFALFGALMMLLPHGETMTLNTSPFQALWALIGATVLFVVVRIFNRLNGH